jgi:hypothetical protein
MDARAEILEKLLELQVTVKRQLITPEELLRIKEIWAEDALLSAQRFAITHAALVPTGGN